MEDEFTVYQCMTDSKQITAVLADLVASESKALLRTPNGVVAVPLYPRLSYRDELIVVRSTDLSNHLSPELKISVWFDVGAEGYFFECVPRIEREYAFLGTQSELFRQQRRAEFRISIPLGFSAFFEIAPQIKLPITNINRLGMAVQLPPEGAAPTGAEIQGTLTLGRRPAFQIAAAVRRSAPDGLGLEFKHERFQSQATLTEQLVYLRHDLYHLKK